MLSLAMCIYKGLGDMSISYGLVNSSDIFMGEWNGGILGPHGVSFFFTRVVENIIIGTQMLPFETCCTGKEVSWDLIYIISGGWGRLCLSIGWQKLLNSP